MTKTVRLSAVIERKRADLPRYVIVPTNEIKTWQLMQTTIVNCTINDRDGGRRTLKKWDEHRWFIELTNELCRRLTLDTDASIEMRLTLLSENLPDELEHLLAHNQVAKTAWHKLRNSQQRQLAEQVFRAKKQETRDKRAASIITLLTR